MFVGKGLSILGTVTESLDRGRERGTDRVSSVGPNSVYRRFTRVMCTFYLERVISLM